MTKVLALAAALLLLTPIALAQNAAPNSKGGGGGGNGGSGPPDPNPFAYQVGNYAGYEVAATLVSGIKASWIVPTPDCTALGTNQFSAAFIWVGLGGEGNTLEQIGTVIACNESPGSGPSGSAKIEFFPEAAGALSLYQSGSFPIGPGDQINASVTYNGQDKSGNPLFGFFMQNVTKNWTFNPAPMTIRTNPPLSDLTAGNWAVEICCQLATTLLPLVPFGSINFTNAQAILNTTDKKSGKLITKGGSINQFPHFLNQACANAALFNETVLTWASPGPLNSTGTSFSVMWGDTENPNFLDGAYPGTPYDCK